MAIHLPDDQGNPLKEGVYQEYTPTLGWGKLYHLRKNGDGFTASDFDNNILEIPSTKPSQYFRPVEKKEYNELMQSLEKSSE